jgi:S1-C subfamily serine protease
MSNLRLVLLLLFYSAIGPAFAQENIISRMENAQASIVGIRTVYVRPMKTPDHHMIIASYERHGAGIIIDPSGIIVTNTHIVINAPHILVALANGKVFEAKVLTVGEGDFSLLKIDPPYKLKAIPWAESSKAQLGESIMAYGSSDLNHQSMLGGIITGLVQSQSTGMVELIELNLNLYQGDSGGPILDQQGRLLGLVMGKEKNEDRKSFAIASDKIRLAYLNFLRRPN